MLPDSTLTRLSELLAGRIGLHFPPERWGDLERGIGSAAHAFGLADAGSYAQRLLSTTPTHHEIEILASCLTVGETYFFRERRSFEALEQRVLPELLRPRWQGERRLRIWSAGCCTGEEPYSIAMLLDRMVPDQQDWNIALLATDINPAFLRKAVRAEYGEWSFRDTPAWLRERYFHHGNGGSYRLRDSIRKRVNFSCLNLADDSYPSLTNNTNAMDLIFCRNVLMYFTPERARAVVDKLHRALVDGGWLIVSPAETSTALFAGFQAVEFDGAIFYRKGADAESPRFPSAMPVPAMLPEWRYVAEPPLPPVDLPELDRSEPDLPTPAPVSEAPAQVEGERLSLRARDCANQGRLDEASEWCRKAIVHDKLNPAFHYLLATIEQEQGLNDNAAQSLLRALYLDDHFVLAHFALGNLRRAQGRPREAQRHFNNALAALRRYAADEVLPESDGLTAGRLGEIVASLQTAMAQSAVTL